MSPQKLPTDKLTLYYSISNSFRDFDFKDATFENIANSHFVVGGLVTKDEKTISLRKLKSKLHITNNTVKEIKPEDIVAESLEECLSSDWLADFLQMMLDCDWMVYSININTFYHSLMGIADIMNIADSKAVGLLKKEICSWLMDYFYQVIDKIFVVLLSYIGKIIFRKKLGCILHIIF